MLALLLVAGPAVAPAEAPARYEAENGRIAYASVAADHPGYSGTGFVDFDSRAGGSVEWTVTASAAGWSELRVRYANGSRAERPMRLTVNGEPLDILYFGTTGGWDTWRDYTTTPLLAAGANTVRLTATTGRGGPNVDRLESRITEPVVDHEAEDAVVAQGVVESRHAGWTGRGYVNPANVAGGYVEWTV
jgi:hypothetical protein